MVVVTDNYKELMEKKKPSSRMRTSGTWQLQGEGPHLVPQHMMEANQRLFLLLVLVVSMLTNPNPALALTTAVVFSFCPPSSLCISYQIKTPAGLKCCSISYHTSHKSWFTEITICKLVMLLISCLILFMKNDMKWMSPTELFLIVTHKILNELWHCNTMMFFSWNVFLKNLFTRKHLWYSSYVVM